MTARPKKSLLATLRLTFIFIGLLVSASAFIWIISTGRIYMSVDFLLNKTLPSLSHMETIKSKNDYIAESLQSLYRANDINSLSASINNLSSALQSIENRALLLRDGKNSRTLKSLFDSINHTNLLIEEHRREIESKIKRSSQAENSRLSLVSRIVSASNRADILIANVEYRALKEFDSKKQREINFLLQDISSVRAQMSSLSTLLAQNLGNATVRNISKSQQTFGRLLKEAIATTSSLHLLAYRKDLSIHLNDIYFSHNQADGFFRSSNALAITNNNIKRTNEAIKNELEKIDLVVREFSKSVNEANRTALSQLKFELNFALIALCILAFAICVAFLLSFTKIVFAKVIRPLNHLTHAISDLSKEKATYQKFDTSTVELFDINTALLIFKSNTERLRLHEKTLEKKNKELDRTNENLRTFTRVSSHDLKSPLRGIRLLCQLAQESIQDRDIEEIALTVGEIDKRAARLNNLLDSLLEYAKADVGLGKTGSVDLRTAIHNQIELLHKSEAFNIEINCPEHTVALHEAPFSMVIRNLVDNAIKHHDRNHGRIKLDVRDDDPDKLIITVEDDGAGIPSQFQERIFKPFQTLRPKDEVEGSGMGLAILTKLIENLGGSITVESPVSDTRGSRFTVIWPRVENDGAIVQSNSITES